MDLAPGEARALDGKLIVGCAAGSRLLLKRAHVVASAKLPSLWSRAVGNLGRSSTHPDNRKASRPALADVAAAEASPE